MYGLARQEIAVSQERACEILPISQRQLSRIENRESRPGPDLVLLMSKGYKRPELTSWFCKEECPIGQESCYDITKKPLEIAALQIIKALHDFQPCIPKLVEITEDGQITDDEQEALEQVTILMMRMEKRIEEWKLSVSDKIDVPALTKLTNEKQTSRREARRSVL